MVIFGESTPTTQRPFPRFVGFDYAAAFTERWHELPEHRDRYVTAHAEHLVLEQRVADGNRWLDANPDSPKYLANRRKWIVLDTQRHTMQAVTLHYQTILWNRVAELHHLHTHGSVQRNNSCGIGGYNGAVLDWSSPVSLWRSLYPGEPLPQQATDELTWMEKRSGQSRSPSLPGSGQGRRVRRAA
jgi:hypothetical protein